MKKITSLLIATVLSSSLLLSQTWTQVSPAPMSTSTGLTIHNGALFSSTSFASPHRSADGSNWVQMSNGLSGTGPQGGGIGSCGSYIYYGSKGDIHRSNDDGNIWTLANTGITVSATNYGRYFYEFNGVYYVSMSAAVTNGGGLFRSTDGTSWSLCTLGGSPGEAAYTMTEIGGKLYVCSNMSFYESSDNGVTWSSVSTNGAKVYNGLFEHQGRRLIHTTFGMEYSDDNGASWDTLTSAIKSSTYCGFIAGTNDTIYTWSASAGVYYSIDNGDSWVDITGDLSSNDVLFMQGMQYFGGNLYVGTLLYVKATGTGAPTGISDSFSYNQLSIYPNPFSNELSIDNSERLLLKTNILDVTGKVVLSETNSDRLIRLNTIGLPRGVYVMKIEDSMTGEIISINKIINQ